MKFAILKEEITPKQLVAMHGFGDRTRKSIDILEPLYMTATLIQANRTFLIVTIDALGSDRSFIVGIKNELKDKFGLEHEEVLINFSHTHHSIYLTGTDPTLRKGGYSISQSHWVYDESELDYTEDEAYYVWLRDTLLKMVGSCYDNLTEGELYITRGASDFACSRRRPDGSGGVLFMPYYEGEFDKDLFVLKLVDKENDIRGILYCYGCHLTAMGSYNYKFVNDFISSTSAMLERTYPGAIAVFLQGCGADLKPRLSVDGDTFKQYNEESLRQLGEVFGKEIITLIEENLFKRINCEFKAKLCEPLLYTEQTSISFYENMEKEQELDDFSYAAVQRTIKAFENGTIKDRIPFYISVWQLGEGISLIALEGEVPTEYALKIKKLFGNGNMIVLGYTNGVFSYVPSRKMIGEGGYEAENNYFFGLRGPFVPEIEDIIIGQIAQGIRYISE